jgi:hypothetical protein
MRSVFQWLFERALVFTDNVRLLPQRTFTTKALLTQPLNLGNGEQLACFLFRKKNGSPYDRKQYAMVSEMFSRLTGRQFDVVIGSGLSQAELEKPNVSLELVIASPWGDIPLAFSGAGIAEALFLSALLAGTSGQVVLLDEPALNLHPPMQTTLLSELQALAHRSPGEGNQFLVSTHAPTLVPPDAIDCVSRFELQSGQYTLRRALDVRRMGQVELVKLRQLLRSNLAVWMLLFSRAVLLVEGATELGALSVWWSGSGAPGCRAVLCG